MAGGLMKGAVSRGAGLQRLSRTPSSPASAHVAGRLFQELQGTASTGLAPSFRRGKFDLAPPGSLRIDARLGEAGRRWMVSLPESDSPLPDSALPDPFDERVVLDRVFRASPEVFGAMSARALATFGDFNAQVLSSSSLLLSSLELSDTKIYEPEIRASLGTAAQICEGVVHGGVSNARFQVDVYLPSYGRRQGINGC